MIDVLVVKYVIVSFVWSIGLVSYFARINADINAKNVSIVFAPWILAMLYFLLFWWG